MAKVYWLHTIELGQGVNEVDFESFILNKFIPIYQQVPGQTVHLLKGERGERAGKYIIVFEFESQEARDQIFPSKGDRVGESAELKRILDDAGSFREERDAFVARHPSTHYLKLSS